MISLLVAAVACRGPSDEPNAHTVAVASDGSFDPPHLVVRAGESVVWQLHDARDAIVSTEPGAVDPCSAVLPYDPDDAVTGPPVGAVGGVFALGPWGAGFEAVAADTCDDCASSVDGMGRCLCATGAFEATMPETWADPDLTGVMIRLGLWVTLPTRLVRDFPNNPPRRVVGGKSEKRRFGCGHSTGTRSRWRPRPSTGRSSTER